MTREAFRVARAFAEGKRATERRTRTDGNNVYLQGNKIAWRDASGLVWITMAGWPTRPTRDRLNAIIRTSLRTIGATTSFCYANIHQRMGRQFFFDGERGREIGLYEVIPLVEPGSLAAMALQIGREEHNKAA